MAEIARRKGVTKPTVSRQIKLGKLKLKSREVQTPHEYAREIAKKHDLPFEVRGTPLSLPMRRCLSEPQKHAVLDMWRLHAWLMPRTKGQRSSNARLREKICEEHKISKSQLESILSKFQFVGSKEATQFLCIPLPKGLKEIQQEARRAEIRQACGYKSN